LAAEYAERTEHTKNKIAMVIGTIAPSVYSV